MSKWQCAVCGAKLETSKNLEFRITIDSREVIITNLSGSRCPECGEIYYDADASDRIDELLEKYYHPVIKFRRKITESGDRKVIGIPKELAEALHIKGGEEVEISLEGKKNNQRTCLQEECKKSSCINITFKQNISDMSGL